jgi:Protein of unknown function (DUF2849)
MSKRTPSISVLTANRLHDGIVVFLGAEGDWVEAIEGALVAHSPEEAQGLQAQGARDSARNLVVEPYLAEVREIGGRLLPVRQRERVRVDGPSVLGEVPGYVAPGEGQRHTSTSSGVRPLASDLSASLKHGGEGSDPIPASEQSPLTEAA